jgi:hypothetical protein
MECLASAVNIVIEVTMATLVAKFIIAFVVHTFIFVIKAFIVGYYGYHGC